MKEWFLLTLEGLNYAGLIAIIFYFIKAVYAYDSITWLDIVIVCAACAVSLAYHYAARLKP